MNAYPSLLILAVSCLPFSQPARAETLSAEGRASGSIFNTTSRQSIQASVTGRGVLRPSGDAGTANGRISSIPGDRTPQATVLGLYRVLAEAQVRYDGGSESISKQATLDVNRRSIIVRGYGRVDLDEPVQPRRKGRQRISGKVTLTLSGI